MTSLLFNYVGTHLWYYFSWFYVLFYFAMSCQSFQLHSTNKAVTLLHLSRNQRPVLGSSININVNTGKRNILWLNSGKQPRKTTRHATSIANLLHFKRSSFFLLHMSDDENEIVEPASESLKKKRRKRSRNKKTNNEDNEKTGENETYESKDQTEQNKKDLRKEQMFKAVGESFRKKKQQQKQPSNEGSESSLLDIINPFKAGQTLRQKIDETITTIAAVSAPVTQSKYYLDDRFIEWDNSGSSSSIDDGYIPEVLVVGATGNVGRLVVRRLLLSGRCRVRVLVRDLYTKTLNLLGTGVTYCQGDLSNIDSLHYAVTDVDKIVICDASTTFSSSVLHQHEQQQSKSLENDKKMSLDTLTKIKDLQRQNGVDNKQLQQQQAEEELEELQWERYEQTIAQRAYIAEQVDFIGMQNLIRAYQDVRHADYGTSQAAKRSLFKFSADRPDDFNLFDVDYSDDDETNAKNNGDTVPVPTKVPSKAAPWENNMKTGSTYEEYDYDNDYNDDYDDYDDDKYDDSYYEDQGGAPTVIESRREAAVQTQIQWIRNRFDHGVFVGRIPSFSASSTSSNSGGAKASIVSTRLRARDDPERGIELGGGVGSGNGFAGFVVRMCADGGTYEAFVRTGLYYDAERRRDGGGSIEYVCEFSTATKLSNNSANKSRNKFMTVRLPFEQFKPVRRQQQRRSAMSVDGNYDNTDDDDFIPPFRGRDVRNIGFRYRASRNVPLTSSSSRLEQQLLFSNNRRNLHKSSDKEGWTSFYLALSYIKLYRSQPEPEIVYLSDARIPPVVKSWMVRHESKRLIAPSSSFAPDGVGTGNNAATVVLDDSTFQSIQRFENDKALTNNNGNNFSSLDRIPEETYYKYRGEEILKKSGLSYAIVRVPGYNELVTGDARNIELTAHQPVPSTSDQATGTYVSRDEVAQVCVRALLDPNALNKSFYVSKKLTAKLSTNTRHISKLSDDDVNIIASQFAVLPQDEIVI